jgi:hypothetical protein
MTNNEWEEFKRQAESDGSPPEVKTQDIVGLLYQRDELLKVAKAARRFLDEDNPTIKQADQLGRDLDMAIAAVAG